MGAREKYHQFNKEENKAEKREKYHQFMGARFDADEEPTQLVARECLELRAEAKALCKALGVLRGGNNLNVLMTFA